MTDVRPSAANVVACGLGKSFKGGIQALTNIDVEIAAGEFVSIVGPSGCGKSTLLKLVSGLIEPSFGDLHVDGIDPMRARRQRQDLAYVFQDATLMPWRSVTKNVRLPLELRGFSTSDTDRRVAEILHTVGLEPFAHAYPRQLSGGMRMRVSIARALVTRPGLLLLDEPFAALDEITRQHLNEELLRLWESDRWTGIFVTHNVAEAVFLSHRVLVMSARPGRLIAEVPIPFLSPRNSKLRHEHDFIRLANAVSDQLQENR